MKALELISALVAYMKKLNEIPVQVNSGDKYHTQDGTVAIKDGIKTRTSRSDAPQSPKPAWISVKTHASENYKKTRSIVKDHKLSTVCEEAKCPNISECWSHGTATIMLLGAICTRACRFCSVDTGNPHGKLDLNEAANAARSVKLMKLDYVVLTSVDRDDLPDGGATQYAAAINQIKAECPNTKVEALTPDFQGSTAALDLLIASNPHVFAQNIETVARLTSKVRDPRAGYQQTLDVLQYVKQQAPHILTKSSIMLGLGETHQEIVQTLADLRAAEVDIVTLGQYLRPTKNHLAVERYVPPAEFNEYRKIGLAQGFLEVAAGPMVRSSYRADRIFKGNNLGLDE